MIINRVGALLSALAIGVALAGADPAIPSDERGQIERALKELDSRLEKLRSRTPVVRADQFAEAAVYAKGVAWALRYDQTLTPADLSLLKKALEHGNERATALEVGTCPWADRKGKVVRAFVSAVDGSVQPYGVMVPANYDPACPMRLDVVLHGSSRPVGMSEVRFMNRFEPASTAGKNAAEQDFIELHPLGRVENCYRWAGETDVFEAIEAASRAYHIDRDRIVLRGMSMGASGTWHLGLKHPDRFVALGPYCGYVDTHHFSETPLPNFMKVGELPPYQEKMLHMLDSVDYAANAGVVPVVACMGEKDVFFQAHVLMGKAMQREGLTLVNLISPGTGHVQEPVTHQEQMRRIGEFAKKGLDRTPRHVRFVTWTLKYNTCHWLRILGLDEHYARAEVQADMADDGSIDVKELKNVSILALRPSPTAKSGARIRVGMQDLGPIVGDNGNVQEFLLRRRGTIWERATAPLRLEGKRPGVQGPIDDAFATPFLCVRGTCQAWNPQVQAWTDATLKRFAYEWHRYFRGELPIKDDRDVTEADARRYNLVLFGDPGSNRWIEKVLPKLPLRWTAEQIQFGNEHYTAADHAPVMIQPSPIAENRYVVLNSGHTFHEKELASLNYLLFPRLGDWAVMKVGGKVPLEERPAQTGFFDEQWQHP